jgi:hypothetical protein
VNGDTLGFIELQIIGPSSSIPVLSALKVYKLSVEQVDTNVEGRGISAMPSLFWSIPTWLNFHGAAVINSVLLLAGWSGFLQPAKKIKSAAHRIPVT